MINVNLNHTFMPKVSVIIPVYGVEKYIERCARSLFEQSLVDIEFVFVNDKTQDKSIEIIETLLYSYPERRDQVKIINHKENLGLPAARKTGIEHATGEYIIQCDSDDWVDKEIYNILVNKAKEGGYDAVCCGYYVTDGTNGISYASFRSNRKEEYITNCLYQTESASLCTKLFHRSLFDSDVIYPKDAMGEDITLSLQLLYRCKSICFVAKPLYFYYNNQQSISRVASKEHTIQRFYQVKNNINIIESFLSRRANNSEDTQKALLCFKHKQRNLLTTYLKFSDVYDLWKNSFPISFTDVLQMPITTKEKILYLLRYFKIRKK